MPPTGRACNCSPRGNLRSSNPKTGSGSLAEAKPCFLPYALWPQGGTHGWRWSSQEAGQILTPSLTTARPLRNNHIHRQKPDSYYKTNSTGDSDGSGLGRKKSFSPSMVAPAHTMALDSCQGPKGILPIASGGGSSTIQCYFLKDLPYSMRM